MAALAGLMLPREAVYLEALLPAAGVVAAAPASPALARISVIACHDDGTHGDTEKLSKRASVRPVLAAPAPYP